MTRNVPWIVGLVVLLAAALGGYAWWSSSQRTAVVMPPPAAQPPPAPTAPAEARIEHPIEAPAKTEPAPPTTVDASDAALQQELSALFSTGRLPSFVRPDNLIRNLVATIDNLPREKAAYRLMPVSPVPGAFEVEGEGESIRIATANAARYRPIVAIVEAVDTRQLAAIYRRFYPLFQQAYAELGYPNAYFNDRLVAVIDHLLAAPEVAAPILLTQPKVLYVFFDPQLESLSVGQKALVRAGPENAARLKAKLREFRKEVARR